MIDLTTLTDEQIISLTAADIMEFLLQNPNNLEGPQYDEALMERIDRLPSAHRKRLMKKLVYCCRVMAAAWTDQMRWAEQKPWRWWWRYGLTEWTYDVIRERVRAKLEQDRLRGVYE